MTIHEHMRCALCGKTSRLLPGRLIPANFRSQHSVEIRTQGFLGGAFDWNARRITGAELAALAEAADEAAARVRREIEERGEIDPHAEIQRLTDEIARRDQILLLLKEQLQMGAARLMARGRGGE